MARQLFRNPGTGGAQDREIGERRRVFDQQQQIGAAPRHGDDQRQRALQREVRVLAAGAGVQQQRHKSIQALPTLGLEALHLPRMEQLLNALGLRPRPREAERLELARVALGAPQRARAVDLFGAGDERCEVPRHPFAMSLQSLEKVLVAAETHGLRERGPGQGIGGQVLGLAIFPGLNRMLRVAQKTIGPPELQSGAFRQATQRRALGQDRQQLAPLQRHVATAADQLKTLGDKLDFANAAGAQFDVAVPPAPADFSHDTPLHVAQAADGAVIHVAPVDKRPQAGLQGFDDLGATGDRARLDQRVTLPVPPPLPPLIVRLERRVAVRQGAAVAVGPQAHVDTEHKTLGIDGVEAGDERAPHPGEELFIAEPAPAAPGHPRLRVGKHQIDIRGQVQLVPAELAHGQHYQFLTPTGLGAHGHAELLFQLRRALPEGDADAGVGQPRHVARGFHGPREAIEIAPDNAQHLPLAQPAQHQIEFSIARRQLVFQRGLQFALAQRRLKRALGAEFDEQAGPPPRHLGGEARAGQHLRELRAEPRIAGDRVEGPSLRCRRPFAYRLPGARRRRRQVGSQCGGIEHPQPSASAISRQPLARPAAPPRSWSDRG